MSNASTERGSTSSPNLAARDAVFGGLICDAGRDAILLECSCAKIAHGTIFARDASLLDLSTADYLAILDGKNSELSYATLCPRHSVLLNVSSEHGSGSSTEFMDIKNGGDSPLTDIILDLTGSLSLCVCNSALIPNLPCR
jgi:hypothetical protein